MNPEKYTADLMAGFGSFKFIPMPIVFSVNNLNPKLILHLNHIEYKGGFITRKLSYDKIAKIDVYFLGKKTNNIWISKTNGIQTFIGNFRSRSQLREFLKIFTEKGCQLTHKAKAEMDSTF